MKVSILTNNSCPNSRAFNCPIFAAKNELRQKGFELKFHYHEMDKRLFNADAIMINSNVFRPLWKSKPSGIFRFLDIAKSHKLKVLWFDTTDSTWVTQFTVLPHVDLFLKSQILADQSKYLKNYRTGRIYTDYFDKLYKSGEKLADISCPADNAKELRSKLRISWNTCLENYTESRLGLIGRISQKLRPLIGTPGGIKIKFTPPSTPRDIDISCRLGTTYDRPSVTAHREAVIDIMRKAGVSCGKLPLARYFAEMRRAKVGIGPFGVGEFTLRDYEIIICGCALVKPDMSHLAHLAGAVRARSDFRSAQMGISPISAETVESLIADSDRRVSMGRGRAGRLQKGGVSGGDIAFRR